MRKQSLYILLDTSFDMLGEDMNFAAHTARSIIDVFKNDPYALETIHFSLYTFNDDTKIQVNNCDLSDIAEIPVHHISGYKHKLGNTLKIVYEQLSRDFTFETETTKGDWYPMIVVVTCGKLDDEERFVEYYNKINQDFRSKVLDEDIYQVEEAIFCVIAKDDTVFQEILQKSKINNVFITKWTQCKISEIRSLFLKRYIS